jgi:hypothetical protein
MTFTAPARAAEPAPTRVTTVEGITEYRLANTALSLEVDGCIMRV